MRTLLDISYIFLKIISIINLLEVEVSLNFFLIQVWSSKTFGLSSNSLLCHHDGLLLLLLSFHSSIQPYPLATWVPFFLWFLLLKWTRRKTPLFCCFSKLRSHYSQNHICGLIIIIIFMVLINFLYRTFIILNKDGWNCIY